jgi:hypothetical protein
MRTVRQTITVSGAADDIDLVCEVKEINAAKEVTITTTIRRDCLYSADGDLWMREVVALFQDAVRSYKRTA